MFGLSGPAGAAPTGAPHHLSRHYLSESWQREQGLPQISVHAVTQDEEGYLWAGTDDGLARFDGVSFTVLNRRTSPQLLSDSVKALLPGRGGGLWIATRRGLYRLADGRFTAYTTAEGLVHDDLNALIEDREGRLWIGTEGGLSRFDGHAFTSYTPRDGLAHGSVWALFEDRQGRLWIGTANGLSRLAGGRFTSYTTRDGLSHDHVRALREDGHGHLWIGTDDGLNRLADGRFTVYTTRDGLFHPTVSAFADDGEGGLWIGTDAGLNRTSGDALAAYGAGLGVPEALRMRALWRDHEGSLWIGTGSRGLIRVAEARFTTLGAEDGLADDLVWALYEDLAGNVWIGTNDGLTRLAPDGATTTFGPRDALPDADVRALAEDADGDLWIGTDGGGLARLADGRLEVFTAAALPSRHVSTLLADAAGDLWIGTDQGLARLADGRLTTYTAADGLPHDYVRVLYEDAQGVLWVGTEGGLARAAARPPPAGGGFAHVRLKREGVRIRSLHGDADGSLWIGTAESGLLRYRRGEVAAFSVADGLFDYLVHQILEDERGWLWMSSNQAVFRARKAELDAFADGRAEAFTSISYDERDGMGSRECNGIGRPAGVRTRDGRLWFPTIRGVAIIDPRRLEVSGEPPPVHIESVTADRRVIAANGRAQLPAGTRELELHFAALSFQQPEKVRYKYRLEGFNRDWVDAGGRRDAFYTNLDPGPYRFQVIAANSDGVWNETGDAFELYLRPAFYQTWPFLAACVAAVVLLGHGLHRLRLRTVLRHNEELRRVQLQLEAKNAEVEARNAELQRFTYAVSHDLKSPLLTVLGFLGFVERDVAAGKKDGVAADIERIRNAGVRMQRLLDELLELSRVGRVRNPPAAVPFAELAREALELVAGRAAARGVEVAVAPGLPTVTGDRPRLVQVVQNLIDNAVKFMGAQSAPRIEIGARQDGGETVFYVRDNGAGIDPRYHEKVFGLFDQLDHDAEGTGMGLSLAQRIVETHGGRIWVESEGQGHGSTFCFTIPHGGLKA